MPAELAEQLRRTLGGLYAISRELGGGGMSRVFEAEDTALGRTVVIKVLHPELAAGVNAERFKREVQLSARLQHPHIVPVLTAGEVEGLPYYVMPFVKGESLRARLAHGPLPIGEAVSVLADVAKALAYAHSEGVVHRDIKPDNVLLSSGAATVADFGIAKALSSARQGQSGETLTSLGTSLGTPAYMAPEQVAGDPNVDQRADIYSFGCVAYELLSGQTPFAGKSPQQLLAAHVMEKPTPIAERRPGLPAPLAALVMRCLEKEPAQRPQFATEIVTQLAASGTHETLEAAPARLAGRRARALAIAAGIAVVVSGAGIAAYRTLWRGGAADEALHLAVAPFEVLDTRLALWKEGAVDVLSRNLDGAGPIRSISPSVAIKQWKAGDRADRASAIAFGRRVGAQLVLYGQLMPVGSDLVDAKISIVDVERASDAPLEIQVRDSSSRMDRVTDSLSVRALARIGGRRTIGAARLASFGSGSLAAIKAFLQGAQFFRRTQWDSAAASFRQAVAIDSTFGIAYAMLAQAVGWASGADDPESRASYRRAGSLIRPGMSARDSLILTAIGHYANSGNIQANRAAEARAAFAAAEAAATRYPNDPEPWYLLGDMRFHADFTMSEQDLLALFDRSIQADSSFAPAYVHATEMAFRYGPDVGRRYAQAYLALNPRDVEADGLRLAAFLADPAQLRSAMPKLLDTVSLDVARRAYPALARLPDSSEAGLLLLRAGMRRVPEGTGKRQVTNMYISQLAMRGHIDEAWAHAVKNKHFASAEIAALGLVPADSVVRTMLPWLELRSEASMYPYAALAAVGDSARLSRLADAIEQFAKTDTARRSIFEYVVASLRAYTALAKRDTAEAIRRFTAIPDSVINFPIDQFIFARLIARQDPRRALALLERRAPIGSLLSVARDLERGRIAERLNEREKSVDAYSYVAQMWAHAESPALRDASKEAREGLARLDPDGRMRKDLSERMRR